MPQLSCEKLTLGYDGKIVASDLTFAVNAGDYLCIAGENGSGKSTLMKTILKLKPPLSGSVFTGNGLKRETLFYGTARDYMNSETGVAYAGLRGERE